jgi:hypothetical protein
MGLTNKRYVVSTLIITQYKFIVMLFKVAVFVCFIYNYLCNLKHDTPCNLEMTYAVINFTVMKFVTCHSPSS